MEVLSLATFATSTKNNYINSELVSPEDCSFVFRLKGFTLNVLF